MLSFRCKTNYPFREILSLRNPRRFYEEISFAGRKEMKKFRFHIVLMPWRSTMSIHILNELIIIYRNLFSSSERVIEISWTFTFSREYINRCKETWFE